MPSAVIYLIFWGCWRQIATVCVHLLEFLKIQNGHTGGKMSSEPALSSSSGLWSQTRFSAMKKSVSLAALLLLQLRLQKLSHATTHTGVRGGGGEGGV